MNEARAISTHTTIAGRARVHTTLLEVVTAVSEITSGDNEVLAVVDHLFRSGQMKLVGELSERDLLL